MRSKKLLCILFALAALYFAAEYAAIPSKIYMTAGEENNLCFDSPFYGELMPQSVEAVSVNSKRVTDNINIDLDSSSVISSEGTGTANVKVKLLGLPLKNIDINFTPEKKVYASGRAVGICVDSKGVLVLGTGRVKGKDGMYYSPAENILKSGDIITEVNGGIVNSKEELAKAVCGSSAVDIRYIRNGNEESCILSTVRSAEDDTNKLGLWIRDSTQGIGTITYYDKETNRYGALGHPINDVDTGKRMEIKGGEILDASIEYAEKGIKGKPGSLQGSIDYSHSLGTVEGNEKNGIFGDVLEDIGGKYVSVGYKGSLNIGDAVILANIESKKIEEFTVHIDSINRYNTENNRNFVITVTDKRLLDTTGGIIQGMSGCPVIQNGKLVGAVTHVFVNDPKRGYGIFIENMI